MLRFVVISTPHRYPFPSALLARLRTPQTIFLEIRAAVAVAASADIQFQGIVVIFLAGGLIWGE